MRFNAIPGLQKEKQTLLQAVKTNHVAHAQLFHGAVGSGNLALALAFGTYINCENPSDTDSCGKCAACNKMDKLIHPDVSFIFPTAGGKKVLSENFMAEWRAFVLESPYQNSTTWFEKINIKQGNIPVEEARKMIGNLSLKSFEGGYKLIYVWLPEYLSGAAANAILKILEEPPSRTLFLLICNSTENLLTTILSRAQRFAVPKFSDEDIAMHLEQAGLENTQARHIALLAEGSMFAAFEKMQTRQEGVHQWFASWMRRCYAFNLLELVPQADDFDGQSKEQQKQILEYTLHIFRAIFLVASGNQSMVRLETEAMQFVEKFTRAFNVNNLHQMMTETDLAIFHIERNVRAKIVFLDLSMQFAKFIK